MIKTKVAFLEDGFYPEQSEKFSKRPDWLEKAGPSKKLLLL